MTDHPQEHDNMSITHCQIDRSSDTCTPHEHESLSAFIEKVEASGEDRKHEAFEPVLDDISEGEMAAAIRTLRGMGYYWNGGEQWRPSLGKKPNFDLIDHWRNQHDALMQAITDPENQPSQFGTVTVEFMEAAVRAERERCAKICNDKASSLDDEARLAEKEGDLEISKSCHASAWLLKVCASRIEQGFNT